jgi:hypothetical protein
MTPRNCRPRRQFPPKLDRGSPSDHLLVQDVTVHTCHVCYDWVPSYATGRWIFGAAGAAAVVAVLVFLLVWITSH